MTCVEGRNDLRREPAGTVAFVLKGYPRLSETFIAQEIHALEARGLPIHIISLRHPTDDRRHPVHDEITAPVNYLPEYLHQEPGRVAAAWRYARRLPGYRLARAVWLRDLVRDRTANRVRRFGQALVLAHELPPDVTHLHAHFIHTPGSVTRYASLLTGLPWSASAHAKDIWTSPDWEKREKLDSSQFTVTCTAVNVAHLRSLAAEPERVALVYHGLDFQRFSKPAGAPSMRSGRDPQDAVVLLSVGRAVAKKGYSDLLDALAALPADLYWRLVHVGAGPLVDTLRGQARKLGIADRIEWRGALAQAEILALYREADLFVLASRIADDGDRDGLPNVLMEAQSQRLACVATAVSAIPELIVDGVTGLLVPQQDPGALSQAIARLCVDPGERARMAEAGMARVRTAFSLTAGADDLMRRFAKAGPMGVGSGVASSAWEADKREVRTSERTDSGERVA